MPQRWTLPHRIGPRRGRAVGFALLMLVFSAATLVLALDQHAAWWVVVALCVLGAVALLIQGFHPESFLELDEEGFTISRPVFWGTVKQDRYLWRDCSNFAVSVINHNPHIAFDHGPSRLKKGAALSRNLLGRDAAFIQAYQVDHHELASAMAAICAEVVGGQRNMRRNG